MPHDERRMVPLNKPDRLKPIPWNGLIDLPRREPLVKRLLDIGGLSVVYGESNSGTSFFALDLAVHVARGLPWRGRRTKQLSGRRRRTRHSRAPDSHTAAPQYCRR